MNGITQYERSGAEHQVPTEAGPRNTREVEIPLTTSLSKLVKYQNQTDGATTSLDQSEREAVNGIVGRDDDEKVEDKRYRSHKGDDYDGGRSIDATAAKVDQGISEGSKACANCEPIRTVAIASNLARMVNRTTKHRRVTGAEMTVIRYAVQSAE